MNRLSVPALSILAGQLIGTLAIGGQITVGFHSQPQGVEVLRAWPSLLEARGYEQISSERFTEPLFTKPSATDQFILISAVAVGSNSHQRQAVEIVDCVTGKSLLFDTYATGSSGRSGLQQWILAHIDIIPELTGSPPKEQLTIAIGLKSDQPIPPELQTRYLLFKKALIENRMLNVVNRSLDPQIEALQLHFNPGNVARIIDRRTVGHMYVADMLCRLSTEGSDQIVVTLSDPSSGDVLRKLRIAATKDIPLVVREFLRVWP